MSNYNDMELYVDPSVTPVRECIPRTNVPSASALFREAALQALRDVRHMLPREGVAIVDAVLHRAVRSQKIMKKNGNACIPNSDLMR